MLSFMHQYPVRNHFVEVSRDKRRNVILKILTTQFFKDRNRVALLCEYSLNGGLYRVCECSSEISTEFV
jgi:hypothetical protein